MACLLRLPSTQFAGLGAGALDRSCPERGIGFVGVVRVCQLECERGKESDEDDCQHTKYQIDVAGPSNAWACALHGRRDDAQANT